MIKALMFGTGSVGSVYGYILSKAGVDVVAVCRSNFRTVESNGIIIHSAIYGEVHYSPKTTSNISTAATYGPFDYVFVCTKFRPNTEFDIAQVVTPRTVIVLAQNGIGIESQYAKIYQDNAIISGVVWLPTTQVSPGVIVMGPLERFEIGTYPTSAPIVHKERVKDLSHIWTLGGGNVLVHDNIQVLRWQKLAINASFNPMCALTRCDGANLLLSSHLVDDVIVEVIREISNIAAAEGIDILHTQSIDQLMEWHRSRKNIGGKDPSMLVDVKAGRPLEVEAILGHALQIAKGHQLQTPRLEMLYCLTVALNFAILKPEGWKSPLV